MPGRRALLIDDADDIREVAAVCLESFGGWEVTTAASGEEGVDVAVEQRPDVILLDMMMPDLDGLGTLRMLQQDPRTRDIPVVFLTAKVRSAQHATLVELGARGVLSKPFDAHRLADDLEALLDRSP